MSVFDQIRVIIYRVHEKGLEVLLIDPDLEEDPSVWRLPDGYDITEASFNNKSIIELDSEQSETGAKVRTFAVEADWHEIPSVRGIIKHDVKRVKSKIKKVVPALERAAYFQVKEAFKKVLPNEYAALKELKDVIRDKNSVTFI
jgi:predicted NUDIX family NTP pyrophosphohydrolase